MSDGRIIPVYIEDEMKTSYMDYAMSVIVGRALPDVRDGLKPVHRRVLYAMREMGLLSNRPYRKSAGVVGEVLKSYHPHGDVAVYDTIVRLAQDFSSRYPLVDGQGNFGCFTKDTKIKLTDGRDLSFEELIKEDKEGKKNYTSTVNLTTQEIEIAEIKNPRLTQKNTRIMKVFLDNGEEIKCTLNHKFMLIGGSYREARFLKSGDSLMPVYLRLSDKEDGFKPELLNYQMMFSPLKNEWVLSHVLADEWNIKHNIYTKSAGRIRHHIDFNKFNNNPENIKRIQWREHWNLHKEIASLQHQNSEYREKIASGRKKFWLKIENREANSKRLTDRNLKNWQNLEYRKKMIKTLSEVNKEYIKRNPHIREVFSQRASATLKRLWKNPEYRELFHQKIVNSNKRRKTNNIRISSYVTKNYNNLSPELYEKVRKDIFGIRSFTRWEYGLSKYFNNDINLVLYEINKNHKVKRIEFTDQYEDVYDLTIENTHNFALASGVFVHNSVDGDPPAAMRYTEVKLTQIAEEMLVDIDKDTVDFIPNYDESTLEPTLLPAKTPNLLINGSSGIAVGMATNIPPHNLAEVIDGIIMMIDKPEIETEDLMKVIKGPDFPTGAYILGRDGIKDAYKTGRGTVKMQAKAHIEEQKGGKERIIVNEIPYQVNKAQLVESIADLVKDKKIEGISDVRDESDRDGMRIVIEVKRDDNSQVVLNQLMKHTQMRESFGIIMLALVDRRPVVLNLKQILEYYLEHRKIIVTRRAKFELAKAEKRTHILEGLRIALSTLDKIIKAIRASKTTEIAKATLIKNFKLTEIQAQAILDMKLQQLTTMEREKIEEEYKALLKTIEELKTILATPKKVLDIIKKELTEIKEKYKDARRSEIIAKAPEEIKIEDLITEEDVVVTLSHAGYIKRLPVSSYKSQHRGGKGITGMETREEDFVEDMFITTTHETIIFFTNKGRCYWLKVHQIPEAGRYAKGKPIVNLLSLKDESITAAMPVKQFEKKIYIVMATKLGLIKKTEASLYNNPRATGIIALKLRDKDELVSVKATSNDQDIVLATHLGKSIRFKIKDVREIGRSGIGVRGIRLGKGDFVVGMEVLEKGADLLTVTSNGFGKRTSLDEYRVQSRGGKGIINIKSSQRNGVIVGIKEVTDDDEIMLITTTGNIIRMKVKDIRTIGRNTQGVKLIKLEEKDKVSAVTHLASKDED